MAPNTRWAGLPLVLTVVLASTGDSLIAGAAGSPRSSGHVPRVGVVERDFRIATTRSVAAGPVKLVVTNRGPDFHELIIVRDRGGALPMKPDGLTVDEDALARDTVGVLEPGRPGQTRTLNVQFRPGRYIMFCNMSGHDLGGMNRRLLVR